MNKNPPTRGRIAAMVAFTLSVFALLLFLWISFGGVVPLKAKGYRFKADFPEAVLLAKEADVRLAGVNIGKVKATELGPGGQTTRAEMEIDSRFAPIKVDTRAILRQKSLLGETFVELAPGQPDAKALPDGGTLARTNVDDTVQLDEVFRTFDPRTRRYFQEWLRDSGIATTGSYGSDLNDALGNAAPFFERGSDLLRPLADQQVALRRVVRDTGRTFDAISRENGQLRGLITNGEATFSALSSRDDALAETFQILPTFLRETRATAARLQRFAVNTDPLVRNLLQPASDLGPTIRDLGDLSPDLEHLFHSIHPLVDASVTGVPAAQRFLEGAEPVLASTHNFLSELNPILSYLSYSRSTVSQFLTGGASSLAGNGVGGYKRTGPGEHYLPQVAIIDSRSLQQRTTRPFWERANSYVVPNAYQRAIPLGVIESFDCNPAGGEQPDPSGVGGNAAPPCFVAPKQLFQDQKYPRLKRGHAPVVAAPTGTQGNSPARP
jgi:phospholipid/cholesterol/gamma-HCH transport system substrate-binding protein